MSCPELHVRVRLHATEIFIEELMEFNVEYHNRSNSTKVIRIADGLSRVNPVRLADVGRREKCWALDDAALCDGPSYFQRRSRWMARLLRAQYGPREAP